MGDSGVESLRDRFLDGRNRGRFPSSQIAADDPPRFLPLVEGLDLHDEGRIEAVLVDQHGVLTLVSFCESVEPAAQVEAARGLISRSGVFAESWAAGNVRHEGERDWQKRPKPGWGDASLSAAIHATFGDWFEGTLWELVQRGLSSVRPRLFVVVPSISAELATSVRDARARSEANLYAIGLDDGREGAWTMIGAGADGESLEGPRDPAWIQHRMRHGKVTLGRQVNPGCYEAVVDGPGTLQDPMRVLYCPDQRGDGGPETASEFLESQGLPFPPIPEGMAGRLWKIAAETYATRPIVIRPYDIRDWVRCAEQDWIEDLALISVDGHGVNSWALHFYLVRGALQLFLQEAWGGAYMNEAQQREEIRNLYEAAGRLVQAANEYEEHARLVDRLLPRGDIRVVVSFYGLSWEIPGCRKQYDSLWRISGHEVVEEATRELKAWLDRHTKRGAAG